MILWFPMFVSSTNWVYLSITPEPDTSCRVFSDVQPPPKLSNWNPWVPQQFFITQQCWMRHQTRCITSAIDTMQRNQIFYSLTLRITLALLTLMWHLSSKAKIMWAWWRLLRLDNCWACLWERVWTCFMLSVLATLYWWITNDHIMLQPEFQK